MVKHWHGGEEICPLPKNEADLLIKGQNITGPFTFQNILLLIALIGAGFTIAISLFLIIKHLHRYTVPKQQRQIIRIIFTPVVFSVLSAVSIVDYEAARYMKPLIALYETFSLASLWLLYLEYVAPDADTRDSCFSNLDRCKKPWFKKNAEFRIIPGGSLKWYQRRHVFVFAYVVIDTLATIIQEITQATGHFCERSYAPRFAHIWVFIIQNVALGFAVFAVITYYNRFKKDPEFSYHKPLLKLVSFKLIVGVNFLQDIVFSILTDGKVHGTTRVTGLDIEYGLPAMLVAVEQVAFAIFFHHAFRSREYHETAKEELMGTRRGIFAAAAHAFNPLDLFQATGKMFILLFSGQIF